MTMRRLPAHAEGEVGPARGKDVGKRGIEAAVRGETEYITESTDGVFARERGLRFANRGIAYVAIAELTWDLRLFVTHELRLRGPDAGPLGQMLPGHRPARMRCVRQPIVRDHPDIRGRLIRRR